MTLDFPSLPDLIALAAKLPLREFTQRFPHHYLITETVGSAMSAPDRLFKTTEIGAFKASQQRGVLGVAPVVKREGVNPYTSMITLGRARNNDVPITDISVSKLHAWIRRGDNGTFSQGDFSITDAGSRNGTFVNGVAVSREPHPLPVGARLRLGLVEFWFVDPAGLHQALRSAPPLPPTALSR
jgi:hypothetical protein